jgi:hypothetical protein
MRPARLRPAAGRPVFTPPVVSQPVVSQPVGSRPGVSQSAGSRSAVLQSSGSRSAVLRSAVLRPAVVLVAHGSRDPRAAVATEALARAVRLARPEWLVRASYLDHDGPRPLDVLGSAPSSRAVLVPLLLTSAYHGRVDMPAVVREAQSLPIEVSASEVLGPVSPLLVDALQRRLVEAVEGSGCAFLGAGPGFAACPAVGEGSVALAGSAVGGSVAGGSVIDGSAVDGPAVGGADLGGAALGGAALGGSAAGGSAARGAAVGGAGVGVSPVGSGLDGVVLASAGTRDEAARVTVADAAAALGRRLGLPAAVAYALGPGSASGRGCGASAGIRGYPGRHGGLLPRPGLPLRLGGRLGPGGGRGRDSRSAGRRPRVGAPRMRPSGIGADRPARCGSRLNLGRPAQPRPAPPASASRSRSSGRLWMSCNPGSFALTFGGRAFSAPSCVLAARGALSAGARCRRCVSSWGADRTRTRHGGGWPALCVGLGCGLDLKFTRWGWPVLRVGLGCGLDLKFTRWGWPVLRVGLGCGSNLKSTRWGWPVLRVELGCGLDLKFTRRGLAGVVWRVEVRIEPELGLAGVVWRVEVRIEPELDTEAAERPDGSEAGRVLVGQPIWGHTVCSWANPSGGTPCARGPTHLGAHRVLRGVLVA